VRRSSTVSSSRSPRSVVLQSVTERLASGLHSCCPRAIGVLADGAGGVTAALGQARRPLAPGTSNVTRRSGSGRHLGGGFRDGRSGVAAPGPRMAGRRSVSPISATSSGCRCPRRS
jgi:hypothetical protein